jgi:hypothetical protein
MNEHEEAAHYEEYDRTSAADGVGDFPESPAEVIEDADSSLQMASQAVKTGFEQLSIVQGISDSLDGKQVCSEAYMTSLENYRPIIEQIIGKLGARRSIPATEDFLNMHRAKSAHLIATEGLSDFLKKTWEKIKEFFTIFFKKIALYLKRMVKANLELENYEEYLEPMMAKLRAKGSSAKPTDLAAFDSKLPSMLADEGMAVMDTEYFLNYGVHKVENLLTLMERVGFKGVGKLNEVDGIPMLQLKIGEFVSKHMDIGTQPLETIKEDARELQYLAMSLLSTVFPNVVSDPKELPEDIYSGIHDAFDRGQMGEGFVLRSLEPLSGGRDNLPNSANLFMAHAADGTSYVEGYIRKDVYVRQMLTPPSNFKSLQNLHDFYKNRIAKIKVQTADKSLDKTNEHIMKLLGMVSKDLTRMVERASTMRRSAVRTEDVAEMLIAATKSGTSLNEIITKVLNPMFGDRTMDVVMDEDYGDVWQRFQNTPPTDTEDYRLTFVNVYAPKLDALFRRHGRSLKDFADGIMQMGGELGQMSEDEMAEAKQVISDVNRMLTNFFTRLQSVLRFIMTNVYGVYTELRYEYARYLYLSAQRYRAA